MHYKCTLHEYTTLKKKKVQKSESTGWVQKRMLPFVIREHPEMKIYKDQALPRRRL